MSNAKQTPDDVYKELVSKGWKESPNISRKYARCFYKRFDTPSRCFHNDDRPGIQVLLAVSSWNDREVGMELEICGGLKDDTWVALLNYALPKTVDAVEALIPRLLRIWEASNT